MIFPDEIAGKAQRQFDRQWRQWAVTEAFGPKGSILPEGKPLLRIGLKPPKEADFARGASLTEAQQWVRAWDTPPHPCQVEWETRHWARIGHQHIPVSVTIAAPCDVAVWAGQKRLWNTALERLRQLEGVIREECLIAKANAISSELSRFLGTWANLPLPPPSMTCWWFAARDLRRKACVMLNG